jgi:predicted transcriptional regulator
MNSALELAQTLLCPGAAPSVRATTTVEKTSATHGAQLGRYIYPKVIKALDNPTRREILFLLLKAEGRKTAFTELKKCLGDVKNASLSLHLNLLQQAWLVERFVDFAQPRTAKDPYYAFYRLSAYGKELVLNLSSAMQETARFLPSETGTKR